ncbi:Elongator complex protein 6 [Acorus calamus]|uniref:Elongator complex protein 6 n=1 Tax=Acorus calamus TaxID=4465 RepID=A0AAV9F7V5_ACOCL|nr:Elongator complex protein 6 [Acorus calamus]
MKVDDNNEKNLLEEALGGGGGRVILVEDRVETSGSFVLHHLLKSSFSSDSPPSVVIFVAFSRPFSHYHRISKKLGCNLLIQKENNRLFFLDMLKLQCPGDARNNDNNVLVELFGKIQNAVEISSSLEYNKGYITIMIDDLSLLEIDTHGSVDEILNFLYYCHTLTSGLGCSLVMLNHEDIYSDVLDRRLLSQVEYLADVVIKAEPLATGLSADVHGQLTVWNKGNFGENRHSRNNVSNFHFKVKENGVDYFYPGSLT